MKKVIIGLFMLLLVVSLTAGTQSVDFNNTTDLETYFNITGSANLISVSDNGIEDTGSLGLSNPIFDQVITYKTGFPVSPDVTLTASVFYYNNDNSGYGLLGFSSSPSNTLVTSGTVISYKLQDPAIGVAYHAGADQICNNTTDIQNRGNGDIPSPSWYKLILSITPKSSNQYDVSYHIYQVDVNGENPVEKRSYTNTFTNTTLNTGLIYPYLGGVGHRVKYVDNFSVTGTNVSADETLPVTLSSFTAITTNNNFSSIQWTTASESNLIGYNIYRSENENINNAMRINPTNIPATNSSTGSKYTYTDAEVEMNSTYYYWLQSTEMNGVVENYGPVSIKISGQSEDVEPVILGSELKDNYPNPFNPVTTFNFYVKDGETANFTIFNLKGQILNTNLFESGEHHYVWNGTDDSGKQVASGIYFYKLQTISYESVRKMTMRK